MGLTHTHEIASFHETAGLAGGMTFTQESTAVGEIFRIYQSKLRGRLFLHVEVGRSDYFDKPDFLNRQAAQNFPIALSRSSEAKRVLDHVADFINHLATRLKE